MIPPRKSPTFCAYLALTCLLLLGRMAHGQSTAFSNDQHLTGWGGVVRTREQLFSDLISARQKLQHDQNSADANFTLGAALQALGETEPASKAFARAVALNPKLSEAWFEQGSILAEKQEWSQASEYFQKAILASPDNIQAHLGLGEMLLRTGEFERARNEMQLVLRLNPRSAGAYQGLGLVQLQGGETDAAVESFRHALQLRPDYRDAEKGLAGALLSQHKWQEAAKLWQGLASEKSASSGDAAALGNALANLGDEPGAKIQFARARKLSDKELLSLRANGDNNHGVSLRNEGKLLDAAAAFRRAVEEDPAHCDAHDNLGGVLWLEKDMQGALAEFQLALACDPNLASARNNLGNALLYYRHDVDTAIQQFRMAVALRPGFALARLNLGKCLASKGDLTGAEPEFRQAIAIDPDLAGAHVALGLLLAMRNATLPDEARAEMQRGIQLDPGVRDLIPPEYRAQLK